MEKTSPSITFSQFCVGFPELTREILLVLVENKAYRSFANALRSCKAVRGCISKEDILNIKREARVFENMYFLTRVRSASIRRGSARIYIPLVTYTDLIFQGKYDELMKLFPTQEIHNLFYDVLETRRNVGVNDVKFFISKKTDINVPLPLIPAADFVHPSSDIPLCIVCGHRRYTSIEALLKCGADPNLEGTNGHTPLESAIRGGYASNSERENLERCILLLLRYGASDELCESIYGNRLKEWCAPVRKFFDECAVRPQLHQVLSKRGAGSGVNRSLYHGPLILHK